MAKGVTLYWRIKNENGTWELSKVRNMEGVVEAALLQSREEE